MHKEFCLDGIWKLLLDPENIGLQEEWYIKPEIIKENGVDIRVPSVWEEIYPGYDGVGWYAKNIEFEEIPGSNFRLHFGSVNYKAEVWVNGIKVGHHEGGYTPFVFDITHQLKLEHANIVVVRVVDAGNEPIDGLILAEVPSSKEVYQGNFGGIWQTVKLIVTGDYYISHCAALPNITDKKLILKYWIYSSKKIKARLEIKIYEKSSKELKIDAVMNVNLKPGIAEIKKVFYWQDFKLWSLDNPILYELNSTLQVNRAISDTTIEGFGMREFTVNNNHFYLNGKEILIKGMLHQGGYPMTITYPENEESARQELQLLKKSGCNMMRLHIKTWDPITLKIADEMGILLYAEPSIGWIRETDRLFDLCCRELKEMIFRDINHPSIVIWGILNETGNEGMKSVGGCQDIRDELCYYTRKLDPSRLIIDDSGSFEFSGRSSIMLPYENMLINTHDRHGYYRSPISVKDYNRLKNMGLKDFMLFRSEYGTGGLPDLPDVMVEYKRRSNDFKTHTQREYESLEYMKNIEAGFKKYHLNNTFSSISEFCLKTQEVQADGIFYETQAMRLNPRIAGFIICQFADYPFETGGGVVDTWRKPKKAYFAMRAKCLPLQVTLMMNPLFYYTGQKLTYEMETVNEGETVKDCIISLSLIHDDKTPVYIKETEIVVEKGINRIESPELMTALPGKYTLKADLLHDNTVLASATESFDVINTLDWNLYEKIGLVDMSGHLQKFLMDVGVDTIEFTGNEEVDLVIVSDLNELDSYTYNRIMKAYSLADRGALIIFLGIGGAKPLSPWQKHVTFDFFSQFFPEKISLLCAEGRVENTFHYIKEHEIFQGLPQNTVINLEYRNVYPKNCIVNENPQAEILAGCYHMRPARWGVDVISINQGLGAIVYNQFDIVSNLGFDPVADLMLKNILAYAKSHYHLQHSPESEEKRRDRIEKQEKFRLFVETDARDWYITGNFENNEDYQGINTPTLIENNISFNSLTLGNFEWVKCTTTKQNNYLIDFGLYFKREMSFTYGVTYFKSTVHKNAELSIISRNFKAWFNNKEILCDYGGRNLKEHRLKIDIQRGWNKILIKSLDESFDGVFNNTLNVQIYNEDGLIFKDLEFTVQEVETAEKEIREAHIKKV